MGFHEGAFAKVWELKPSTTRKSTSVRLSISKKVEGGQYEDDFSGYVSFIGTANKQAATLKKGDRIKLGGVDVSSQYNADKRERSYSFKVFSYEMADGPQGTAKSSGAAKNRGSLLDAVEDGELPDDFPA